MKKLLVLTLALMMVFSVTTLAAEPMHQNQKVGIYYGAFETEGGSDVDSYFLQYEEYYTSGYHFDFKFGIGDADKFDYDIEMTDLGVYKRVGASRNYIGAGYKHLNEEAKISCVSVDINSWAIPIKFKTIQSFDSKTRFVGKLDYILFGDYDVTAVSGSTGVSGDGDFEGYAIDLSIERDITDRIAARVGYVNEDYEYDDLNSGFDGLYLGANMSF